MKYHELDTAREYTISNGGHYSFDGERWLNCGVFIHDIYNYKGIMDLVFTEVGAKPEKKKLYAYKLNDIIVFRAELSHNDNHRRMPEYDIPYGDSNEV